MPALIDYQCREPRHLAGRSRLGVGGIVFRHGTAAYCDGSGVDGAHHWVPTGGVPLDALIGTANTDIHVWEDRDVDGRARSWNVSDQPRIARPLQANP